MFYKQFLKFIDTFDKEIIEDIDFWLATLPDSRSNVISTSLVSSKFGIEYSIAEIILDSAYKGGILKKKYMIVCADEDCEFPVRTVEQNELLDILGESMLCTNCECEFQVSLENTYVIFERIKLPEVPEAEIKAEVLKRLGNANGDWGNFSHADSLANNEEEVYKLFYDPDESAYVRLLEYQGQLDAQYENTTEKGNVLEELAVELFNQIKGAHATNKLKTYTNQFDCTVKMDLMTTFPSVIQILVPYFIVECKNEKVTPSNTYFHKLSDIMSCNEAKVGIVMSRKKASTEDMQIAHDQYLLNKATGGRYLISLSDDDLDALIKKRVNLLKYLNHKIVEMTTNARNATYEMFEGKRLEER